VQGTGAQASKEANKNVAKDNDANVTTRASAAKDAAVDKKDEFTHNTKADVHKGMSIGPDAIIGFRTNNIAEASKN
jgi:hypothetical protein